MDAKNRVIASLLDRGHCLWGKLGYSDASASDIESSSDAENRDSRLLIDYGEYCWSSQHFFIQASQAIQSAETKGGLP